MSLFERLHEKLGRIRLEKENYIGLGVDYSVLAMDAIGAVNTLEMDIAKLKEVVKQKEHEIKMLTKELNGARR